MKKHLKIIILVVLSLLLLALLFSYGYWQIEVKQKNDNQLAVQCIDISITNEENAISLKNQYPIKDEEGATLTPYTFTVSNNCNKQVDYQIDLELLGTADTSASASYMKIKLDDKNASFLNDHPSGILTLSDAFESYQIGFGRLEAKGTDGDSDTHNLRVWVDFDTPISEKDKIFKAKVTVSAGQDLEYVFDEGTLAFDILAQHGGLRNTGIRDIKRTKVVEEHNDYSFSNLHLSYTKWDCYESYEYNDEFKFYILKGLTNEDITVKECADTVGLCGKYCRRGGFSISELEGSNYFREFDWNSLSKSDDEEYYYLDIKEYEIEISGDDKDVLNGLNSIEDDYGLSYYVARNSSSVYNKGYVQFGYLSADDISGSAGDPMYWRIVRINGDGTIRMIYDGIGLYSSGWGSSQIIHDNYISKSAYDTSGNIGYTYEDASGNQIDSTIKTVVDGWYEVNLKDKYEKYIADRSFCDDKSKYDDTYTKAVIRDGLGLYTLSCDKNDRYTVSSENGNGLLTYPIGLITMDEIGLGLEYIQDSLNWWSYTNGGFWAMTSSSNDSAYKVIGSEYPYSKETVIGVRPVINLKADVEFTGKGTINDPYVIKTN